MNKILLLLLIVSTSVFAHDERNTYGGISAGRSIFDDSDELAGKLFLGHRVIPYVGFEISAINFGDIETTNGLDTTVVSTVGVNPEFALYLPLGGLQLFAKAGALFWESETRLNRQPISDDDGSGLSLGLGFAIFFDEQFFFRGEVESFEFSNGVDPILLTTFGIGFAI